MTLVELEYPKIERLDGDDRYARFACEPLPPGYGTTLGNSLRRVLLSSLPGAAITAARGEGLPIGVIPIDALFSPVRKVNFSVESTRVGQVTNYDRLILEVWTDGTTTPDDAVAQGSAILVQQFSLFAGLTRSQAALSQPERTNGSSLPSAIADMPTEY